MLALREVTDPPPPAAAEIQVRITARGVQFVDVLMLAGHYQFRPDPPFIPGSEAAGTVVAVGANVSDFAVFDAVMSRHTLGAWAEHAIDYRSGFVDQVKALTGGRGVDIVYDPTGDKVAEEALRCLCWGGRLLILGSLGGGPTNIRSNYLLIKGIDAIGVRIGGLNEADPARARANMTALVGLAEQGKLRPRISHTFRLDQAAEALQAVLLS